MAVTDLTSAPPTGKKAALFFWASWHSDSAPRGAIDRVFHTLASTTQSGDEGVDFYRVEAEAVPDLSLKVREKMCRSPRYDVGGGVSESIGCGSGTFHAYLLFASHHLTNQFTRRHTIDSTKYAVTVVPTFILLDAAGNIVDRVDGGDDVPRLTQAVSSLASRTGAASAPTTAASSASAPAAAAASPEDALNARLKSLINSSPVMLFMKGVPTAPRCGFSRQAVEMLSEAKVAFGTFDILTDEDVRQGLKKYSDWPTYPQLYVNGDLMGGLDIMKEMAEEGDLAEQLGVEKSDAGIGAAATSADANGSGSLDDRLKKLINRHRVMLFMKGLPSAPRCGFSRQIVEMLDEEGASYDSFNILEDEEVRQGLKTYSDWPTYPQLYVDGDLVGGLDIVKEMKESDDLSDLLQG